MPKSIYIYCDYFPLIFAKLIFSLSLPFPKLIGFSLFLALYSTDLDDMTLLILVIDLNILSNLSLLKVYLF